MEPRPGRAMRHAFLVVVLAGFLAVFVGTLSDYGVTWDSAYGELYLGDKNFWFLTSWDLDFLDPALDNIPIYGNPDHPDFFAHSAYARRLPHHVWGAGPLLTAVTKHLGYTVLGLLDPIDAHHLVLGLLVAVQCAALYYFATHYFGFAVGMSAVLCLLLHPRYWAHLHNNPKDVPEAVFFTLTILGFCHGIIAWRARYVLIASALFGLALAVKANAFFLPVVLGPWLLLALRQRRRSGQPIATRPMLLSFLVGPVVAGAVFFASWPYLLGDFPNRLDLHVQFLMDRAGQGPDHWQIEPVVNALITTPLAMLALAAVGLFATGREILRRSDRHDLRLLVLLWLVIPVLRVSLPRARDFDVIRHWIEFLPALALLAGFGVDLLVRAASRRMEGRASLAPAAGFLRTFGAVALVLLALLPVALWSVKNHPYQLVFYNGLTGRLGGAQEQGRNEATDYWGSSYRSGLRWINQNAEPDAMLVVPVAEHIVFFVHQVWLRGDVELVRTGDLDRALRRSGREVPPVYFMYVTREPWYPDDLKRLESISPPVYEITVDGGPILRILKLSVPKARSAVSG